MWAPLPNTPRLLAMRRARRLTVTASCALTDVSIVMRIGRLAIAVT
jgi:hypothetical protein